jgi:hypothetical protein
MHSLYCRFMNMCTCAAIYYIASMRARDFILQVAGSCAHLSKGLRAVRLKRQRIISQRAELPFLCAPRALSAVNTSAGRNMQKYAALLTASTDGLRETAAHTRSFAAAAFILRKDGFENALALMILLFYAVFLFDHFVPLVRCTNSLSCVYSND